MERGEKEKDKDKKGKKRKMSAIYIKTTNSCIHEIEEVKRAAKEENETKSQTIPQQFD